MRAAEYENAMVLYAARFTPMDWAAISLSRMATHARPVGECSRLRVIQRPPMRKARAREEKALSLAKEIPKMTGLSTGRPLSPWVTPSHRVNTSWMMRAKARVAMVRYTPVMRRAGSPTSTPVAEVKVTARATETIHGSPRSWVKYTWA